MRLTSVPGKSADRTVICVPCHHRSAHCRSDHRSPTDGLHYLRRWDARLHHSVRNVERYTRRRNRRLGRIAERHTHRLVQTADCYIQCHSRGSRWEVNPDLRDAA